MPKPFHQLSLEQFVELLVKFPFTRKIESIHLHHTWRPNRAQYQGEVTLNSMWEFHTKNQGWSDIAQHITIAPDGSIWTGRSWNQPPASAKGFNGNATSGPFMFEMIGDFDRGRDPFDGPQKQTVLAAIAHVQQRFSLAPDTLRFHNTMSDKSCPGSALDRTSILAEVVAVRATIGNPTTASSRAINFPFGDQSRLVWQIIDLLKTPSSEHEGGPDEGCAHQRHQATDLERSTVAPPPAFRTARADALSPEIVRSLRPHVINLNQGRLSTTGAFQNTEADVDAIFEDHFQQWAATREGQTLPIVFYAHGGLTSEQSGLLTADEQVQWWLENGAYPIHFVWETGLFETLGQLLNPARQRGIDFAAPSDFALETLARGIGGVKVWAGMKTSAERASAGQGGARYAALKLKELCAKPELKDRIELHAIGHSAGSIFHAHFLAAALDLGGPHFKTVHFLAPAIRVDTFENLLLPKIGAGQGIEQLCVFTMARDFELDDNCFTIYRKSLLYLIYYALEPDRKTPILGLEESIRANPKLKRLFNLDRTGAGGSEVVWSVSRQVGGRSATTSRTHGGFNNDAPTMESVARRILGREVTPFTGTGERGAGVVENLQTMEPSLIPLLQPARLSFPAAASPAPSAAMPKPAAAPAGPGRRRALCVGIDRYPTAPLAGCANDAREWRRTFQQLGFEEPQLLLDGEATRIKLLETLTELIRSSQAGDVVAFQFAGHGTQLPDLDGDEAGGDTPNQDEALCPIDFHQGHFLIDDDLAAVFDQIPEGVSVTIFADCCHSGSNTRLAIGTPPVAAPGRDVRKRFMVATAEMKQAHAAFRASLGGTRKAGSRSAYDQAREVLFAACRSREVALESDGHGHFTTRAMRVLTSGIEGMTNAEFHARVVSAFGENSGQNPELHCADALRSRMLLSPIAGASAGRAAASAGVANDPWRGEVARILESAAKALRG